MEFNLISTFHLVDFIKGVNQALRDGWELWGPTFMDGRGCYSQAVIRMVVR